MEKSKKRQRSQNWLEEDKQLLTDLVRERVLILENKNTATNTNNKKKEAWIDLLNSFNAMCHGSIRTTGQLKAQWGVMKMIKKKSLALERREAMATGGGPLPQRMPAHGDDIAAWLPNEFPIDTNVFDSDSTNVVRHVSAEENVIIEMVEVNEIPEPTVVEEATVEPAGKHPENEEDKENQEQMRPPTRKRKRFLNRGEQRYGSKESHAASVATSENTCRQELHRLQMENELRKARNLDLEEEMIREKRDYWKKMNESL